MQSRVDPAERDEFHGHMLHHHSTLHRDYSSRQHSILLALHHSAVSYTGLIASLPKPHEPRPPSGASTPVAILQRSGHSGPSGSRPVQQGLDGAARGQLCAPMATLLCLPLTTCKSASKVYRVSLPGTCAAEQALGHARTGDAGNPQTASTAAPNPPKTSPPIPTRHSTSAGTSGSQRRPCRLLQRSISRLV